MEPWWNGRYTTETTFLFNSKTGKAGIESLTCQRGFSDNNVIQLGRPRIIENTIKDIVDVSKRFSVWPSGFWLSPKKCSSWWRVGIAFHSITLNASSPSFDTLPTVKQRYGFHFLGDKKNLVSGKSFPSFSILCVHSFAHQWCHSWLLPKSHPSDCRHSCNATNGRGIWGRTSHLTALECNRTYLGMQLRW